MTSVACIGECMIELKQAQGGLYSRGYGGDTLNTAVYLARLGVDVDYITALGDDSLSDEMIAGWTAEGVGIRRVARLKGKLPGLYMIQTDDNGREHRQQEGKPERQSADMTVKCYRRRRDAADGNLALAADIGEIGAVRQDEAEPDQRERQASIDRCGNRIG